MHVSTQGGAIGVADRAMIVSVFEGKNGIDGIQQFVNVILLIVIRYTIVLPTATTEKS